MVLLDCLIWVESVTGSKLPTGTCACVTERLAGSDNGAATSAVAAGEGRGQRHTVAA